MNDLLTWAGGTLLQWTACLSTGVPFMAIACRGKTKFWLALLGVAIFFGGCLLLVRLEIAWVIIRSPWQAMVLEALFALEVILLTRSCAVSGLTLNISRQAWRAAAIVSLLLVLYTIARGQLLRALGLAQQSGSPGLEYIIYQATLPGIAEELAYRGVIQSRLNSIFPRPWNILGSQLGWGFLITSVLFWTIHAFRVDGFSLSFYWQTLTMQLIASLVLGWLRERSGSIFPGILAHNLVNVAWTII